MRADLTDMRLFLSVVEHGSLTQGAQAMNLALASVSERVARMEAALGAPLLERTRRGVRPTPAGDAFARHARAILRQVEAMNGDLHTYARGAKGRVRLLSNTAALAGYLPPRLRSFLAAWPDLSVDLEERPSSEIVEAVAEGRAELGIVADIADLTTLQTHLVARDRLVVVANRAHRIADAASVTFAEIVGEAFIGLADAALEIHLAERASRIGQQIAWRVKLRNVTDVGQMIEAGIGIAVLSEACVTAWPSATLAVVTLAEPWASRQLYLCARDFAALTRHADLLARHLGADTLTA